MSYADSEIEVLRKNNSPTNINTWPFFPIIMPLLKGRGPVSAAECDEIIFEVWDQHCLSSTSHTCLRDAIQKAMVQNLELLKEPS